MQALLRVLDRKKFLREQFSIKFKSWRTKRAEALRRAKNAHARILKKHDQQLQKDIEQMQRDMLVPASLRGK